MTGLDLSGRTVLPGLVGVYDRLFYIARPNLDTAGHSDRPIVAPLTPSFHPASIWRPEAPTAYHRLRRDHSWLR